jgi:hypothetical protein
MWALDMGRSFVVTVLFKTIGRRRGDLSRMCRRWRRRVEWRSFRASTAAARISLLRETQLAAGRAQRAGSQQAAAAVWRGGKRAVTRPTPRVSFVVTVC